MAAPRGIFMEDFNLNENETLTCSFAGCGKVFLKPSRLRQHETWHTGEKPYKCSFDGCNKTYKRPAHLRRHVESAHNSDIDVFECETEGCEKTYTSIYGLNKHTERSHSNVTIYKCNSDGCEQSFAKRFQLRRHSFEHNGALPFQCHHEGCKKIFTQSSHLKRHLKGHEGYDCDAVDCEKHFDKWSLLRKHKAKDHKPVQKCQSCDKSCSTKAQLDRHVNIEHSNDLVRLYKCTWADCSKVYPDSSNLKSHVRSFHEGIVYNCPQDGCGKSLATKQKLRQHLKLHDPSFVKEKKHRSNVHRKKTLAEKLCRTSKASTPSIDCEHALTSVTSADNELIVECDGMRELLNNSADLVHSSNDISMCDSNKLMSDDGTECDVKIGAKTSESLGERTENKLSGLICVGHELCMDTDV